MRARFFLFGLGFSAKVIAARLEARGFEVLSTGRDGTFAFDDAGSVRAALADCSHVLSSVPPGGEGLDPVLETYGDALTAPWIGYLSSTGVYGDCGGAWVDETAPVGRGRRTARAEADLAWQALGSHVRVFRLPGIYGPGRSVFDRLAGGGVQRIDARGQVFSRVHVDDIAGGVIAALDGPTGVYNLADDEPCSQNRLIEVACAMTGREPPPLVPLDAAGLSPMARAFYAENRRVANGRAKRVLGWRLRYPTWREGLRAVMPSVTRPS